MRKTFAAILATCYLCYFNIAQTQTLHKEIKPPKKLTKVEKQQVECLAQNVYYEAGYESTKGQIAVALVTLNRVHSGLYPKSICGTMTQKTEDTCQFSWYCDDYKRIKATSYRYTTREKEVFAHARSVALYTYLNYKNMQDVTKGALFFHTKEVNPAWRNVRVTTTIGNHIFYKRKA
jgi:spore germination cell wall hydrolase CwlJ-like protein